MEAQEGTRNQQVIADTALHSLTLEEDDTLFTLRSNLRGKRDEIIMTHDEAIRLYLALKGSLGVVRIVDPANEKDQEIADYMKDFWKAQADGQEGAIL